MATSSDDPPADAIPLQEALVVYADAQLVEARRVAGEHFVAAYGFSHDSIQHSLTNQAEQAARSQYYRASVAITHAFRERVRTGHLRVWAREMSPVGPLRLLPADAWRYIEFRRNDILVVPVPGREPICYFGAIVAPPAIAPLVASTIAAETRCRNWLVELMRDGRAPSSAKADYEKEAVEKFNVSARAFRRAWDAAIGNTGNVHWRRAGRKPKP